MKKTIKLGKMERDYGYPGAAETTKDDGDHKMVERFPTVYISHKDLPKLEPGDEVTLKAKVVEYGQRDRKVKEDGETDHETHRNCELDVTEIHVDSKEDSNKPTDEDEIDKGLDAAMDPGDDEEGEEEEE